MARVMAQARRPATQKHGRNTKRPLTRAFTAERVTRIELAWPAWKESARLLEPTRIRLLV
jgi:hypothetical protein